jgi:hypothetical protein
MVEQPAEVGRDVKLGPRGCGPLRPDLGVMVISRGGGIRTRDDEHPKLVHYQAVRLPVKAVLLREVVVLAQSARYRRGLPSTRQLSGAPASIQPRMAAKSLALKVNASVCGMLLLVVPAGEPL